VRLTGAALVLLACAGVATAADRAAVLHDSRDPLYRSPSGAVPEGTPVTLRVRTARGDASSVTVFTWDEASRRAASYVMRPAWSRGGHELWEAVVPAPAGVAVQRYRFVVRSGRDLLFYEDDPPLAGHEPDGGAGRVYDRSPDRGWTINWYARGFEVPAWAQGAVVYQVFPDRFANGDPSNDPRPSDPTVHGRPVLARAWSDRPEGHCRYYTDACCSEDPRQRDFFGGDLDGLRVKLPWLADLGVDVVYLNPIFASATNHRYDTRDFGHVDPALGGDVAFDRLVEGAKAAGIRLLLDGVFNHTSSDSLYFDKERRYPAVGAYESRESPHAAWYTFYGPWPDGYRKWFGVDSLPVLAETEPVKRFLWGEGGIAHRWLEKGGAGWRLDALEQKSHGFWREFRAAVRARRPDAFIVGEFWHDATPYLGGDQLDSVMNYRFRDALIGFVNGDTLDANGPIAGLTATRLDALLRAVLETTPPPAQHALLNLVDSHDTERILWTLAPGRDRPEEKERGAGYERAVARLKLLSTLQMTLPGAPGVYYGDEAGVSGDTDPDNRRPYPWGTERKDLVDHYRAVMRLRRELPCLRTGSFTTLLTDDAAGVFAFARQDGRCTTLVVANRGEAPVDAQVPVDAVLADGAVLRTVRGAPGLVTARRLFVRVPAGDVVVLAGPGRAAPPAAASPLGGWEPLAPRPPRVDRPVPEKKGKQRAPVVTHVSAAAVSLSWDCVPCELVRRTGSGPWVTVTGPGQRQWTDAEVLRGTPYRYALREGGALGQPVDVTPAPGPVRVTLRVAVPDPGASRVHVAGNFQGWVAGATPLTREADGRWTTTVTAREGERLEYKFTLGTWDAVEKGPSLEEPPNRVVVVEPDASGRQRVEDVVQRWRDADPCKQAERKAP
jgi:glycosidase